MVQKPESLGRPRPMPPQQMARPTRPGRRRAEATGARRRPLDGDRNGAEADAQALA